jgi:hypothetical protein
MLHAIWKGPPAAPPQLWLLPRPALHSCAAGPHQRHLSPEHIVPKLRGRQPALLAADMAMHMELWGPLLPAPLSYDLVPQQACVEAMHLRGVDAGTNRQPQVASDVVVGEGVAARAGGRRARAAGPRQVLHCQLAGLERRRLKQRGLHLWVEGVCQEGALDRLLHTHHVLARTFRALARPRCTASRPEVLAALWLNNRLELLRTWLPQARRDKLVRAQGP